jgi:hypothetical protein
MEQAEKQAEKKHPAVIVGDLMTTFAAVVRGQITLNDDLTDADRIAAFNLMGKVMIHANVIALSTLAGLPEADAPLAWNISAGKVLKTAKMYADEMLGIVERPKPKKKTTKKTRAKVKKARKAARKARKQR